MRGVMNIKLMSKMFGRKVEKLTEELRGLNSGKFNNLCFSENIY